MIAATSAVEVGPRGHVTQFYQRDEELADLVGPFLAEALHDGGVAIAIATPAHRAAFETRLAAAGIDVAGARTRGDFHAVDAEEALRRLMAGTTPDADGFDRIVCSLIEEPARHGRTIHIYGELVAVLWDAGLANAAIELEELWVGLARRLSFALWCGYRVDESAGKYDADGVAEIFRLHTDIVGQAPTVHPRFGASRAAAKVSRDFTGSTGSVGSARRFVVAALQVSGHGAVADDAALVVTELAANAVLHARSDFTVTLTLGEGRIRIGVRDHAALPRPASGPPLPAEPLHGLGAVAALAVRWGAAPASSGKDVWAELRC